MYTVLLRTPDQCLPDAAPSAAAAQGPGEGSQVHESFFLSHFLVRRSC